MQCLCIKRLAVKKKASGKFGSQVLRISSRTAIATKENAATLLQAINHYSGCFFNRR